MFAFTCQHDPESCALLMADDTELLTAIDSTTYPLQVTELRNLTLRDADMKTLVTCIQTGFPNTREEATDSLMPYWPIRHQLQYKGGLVFNRDRMVILNNARKRVLETLHSAHQGVTGMQLRAAETV